MTAISNEWNDMNICELHGFIIAVVSVCYAPSEQEWQVLFENAFVPALPTSLLTLVTEEAEDIHALLQDKDDAYTYQPLLPDDSHAMIEQVTGISSWANGFLPGYAITSTVPRPDEKELLISLQSLARLKMTQEELDEVEADTQGGNAADYEELLEFARIVPVSISSIGKFTKVTSLPIIAGLPVNSPTRH